MKTLKGIWRRLIETVTLKMKEVEKALKEARARPVVKQIEAPAPQQQGTVSTGAGAGSASDL